MQIPPSHGLGEELEYLRTPQFDDGPGTPMRAPNISEGLQHHYNTWQRHDPENFVTTEDVHHELAHILLGFERSKMLGDALKPEHYQGSDMAERYAEPLGDVIKDIVSGKPIPERDDFIRAAGPPKVDPGDYMAPPPRPYPTPEELGGFYERVLPALKLIQQQRENFHNISMAELHDAILTTPDPVLKHDKPASLFARAWTSVTNGAPVVSPITQVQEKAPTVRGLDQPTR